MTDHIDVIQSDREAAASFVRWQRKATDAWKQEQDGIVQFFVGGFSKGIIQGIWDSHPVVQAFARHRVDALEGLLAGIYLHDEDGLSEHADCVVVARTALRRHRHV